MTRHVVVVVELFPFSSLRVGPIFFILWAIPIQPFRWVHEGVIQLFLLLYYLLQVGPFPPVLGPVLPVVYTPRTGLGVLLLTAWQEYMFVRKRKLKVSIFWFCTWAWCWWQTAVLLKSYQSCFFSLPSSWWGIRELLLLLEAGLLARPPAPLHLQTLLLGLRILPLFICLSHHLNRWKYIWKEAINFIKRYDSHWYKLSIIFIKDT